MMVKSIVHGAVSIVNAIPLGIGSTLGISLKVVAKVILDKGSGITIINGVDTSLIKAVINRIIPANILSDHSLSIDIESEIPSGYGLKSSSAVSNALSLALTKLFKDEFDDLEVINHAIDASFDANVTITGAFDDAVACYFGGFFVTDNYARKIIRHDDAKIHDVIILLPSNVKRTDPLRMRSLAKLFEEPVRLAKEGMYYEAMMLNGVIVASILGIPYQPIKDAIDEGAIAASVSGNGPAIAIITDEKDKISEKLSKYGKIINAKTSNIKASVEVI
ncbi:MAG: shikimate kinase [Candidatus Nitrosocaldaceae archaeon]